MERQQIQSMHFGSTCWSCRMPGSKGNSSIPWLVRNRNFGAAQVRILYQNTCDRNRQHCLGGRVSHLDDHAGWAT